MKLPLQLHKDLQRWAPGAIAWTSCPPFIENARAALIHRPRRVTTHKIGKKYSPHIAVECWCGASFTGTKKFTFLDAPPDGKLLCFRCEEKAVHMGQLPASTLVGGHVHTGTVVAVQTCCMKPKTDKAKRQIQ